jgi:hypothetical protein
MIDIIQHELLTLQIYVIINKNSIFYSKFRIQ